MIGLEFFSGIVLTAILYCGHHFYQWRTYNRWQDETCECTCDGCSCHLFLRRLKDEQA